MKGAVGGAAQVCIVARRQRQGKLCALSPVLRPASTSMRVVLPAPDTPIRQVSTPEAVDTQSRLALGAGRRSFASERCLHNTCASLGCLQLPVHCLGLTWPEGAADVLEQYQLRLVHALHLAALAGINLL